MATSGVPDILAHARLSRVVSDVKARAQAARTEVASGRVGDVTKAANGDIGGVQLLKKAVDDAKSYRTSLALAANRATLTQNVLGVLTSESARLATGAYAALGAGDEATMRTIAKDAKGALYAIFGALNTTDGGRSLFAGDATNAVPLGSVDALLADIEGIIAAAPDAASAQSALDAYFNDPAGGFQTSIYGGGANDAPAVELAPGIRVGASVKADAQPIKDVIRGFAVLANFATAPGGSAAERDALMTGAAELSLAAEQHVVDMRAVVGVSESRIAATIERYQSEETVLSNMLAKKTTRDPFEAASELQLLESQLEAAYLVTSRLARLSIAAYLK